ncbi:YraN family protein [soil metagenome]
MDKPTTSSQRGAYGEERAAAYLVDLGYKIVDRNWKTRYCEIDIIAKNKKRIYFYEVKYRASSQQGKGYEYVTPKKLAQMSFAAQMWVRDHTYKGDFQLGVVSVDGDSIELIDEIWQ